MKCARTLDYKYIWTSDAPDEIYNIREDPDEQRNLIKDKPEVAKKLMKKIEDFLLNLDQKDYGDYLNTPRLKRAGGLLNVDPEVVTRLKVWGLIRYVIGQRRTS